MTKINGNLKVQGLVNTTEERSSQPSWEANSFCLVIKEARSLLLS